MVLALFVVLWAVSYWTFDRVSVPLSGRSMLIFISYRGQFSAVYSPTSIPRITDVWRERGDVDVPGNTYPDQFWPRRRVLGFGWITNTLYLNTPNPPVPRDQQFSGLTGRSWACACTGLAAPVWFAALVLLGVAALPWVTPRYSVRTLLVAMTLVALVVGAFAAANRAPLERLPLE